MDEESLQRENELSSSLEQVEGFDQWPIEIRPLFKASAEHKISFNTVNKDDRNVSFNWNNCRVFFINDNTRPPGTGGEQSEGPNRFNQKLLRDILRNVGETKRI